MTDTDLYLTLIVNTAQAADVLPEYMLGIVDFESGGNPSFTGIDGRVGLAGLRPTDAAFAGWQGDVESPGDAVSLTGLYDPETNLKYAAIFFRMQMSSTYGYIPSAYSKYDIGPNPYLIIAREGSLPTFPYTFPISFEVPIIEDVVNLDPYLDNEGRFIDQRRVQGAIDAMTARGASIRFETGLRHAF